MGLRQPRAADVDQLLPTEPSIRRKLRNPVTPSLMTPYLLDHQMAELVSDQGLMPTSTPSLRPPIHRSGLVWVGLVSRWPKPDYRSRVTHLQARERGCRASSLSLTGANCRDTRIAEFGCTMRTISIVSGRNVYVRCRMEIARFGRRRRQRRRPRIVAQRCHRLLSLQVINWHTHKGKVHLASSEKDRILCQIALACTTCPSIAFIRTC